MKFLGEEKNLLWILEEIKRKMLATQTHSSVFWADCFPKENLNFFSESGCPAGNSWLHGRASLLAKAFLIKLIEKPVNWNCFMNYLKFGRVNEGSMDRTRRNKWETESSQKLILQRCGVEKAGSLPVQGHPCSSDHIVWHMGALHHSAPASDHPVWKPRLWVKGRRHVVGSWDSSRHGCGVARAWTCRMSPKSGHTEGSLMSDQLDAQICNLFL